MPPDLPGTYALCEEMFVKLISEEKHSFRVFPSWAHLAEELMTEYLHKNGDFILPLNFGSYERAHRIFNKPLYEFKPKIETTDGGMELTVANRYYGSPDVHFHPIDVAVMIKLQRIAGHVGYANPEISVVNTPSSQLVSGG